MFNKIYSNTIEEARLKRSYKETAANL